MASEVSIQTALTQQAQTTAASQSLASDFTQFLTLLTTQLQNQDPLSPIDSTEFTSQLVAFAGVEQQVNSNAKLDSLVALQLSNTSSAALNYVGKKISYVSGEFDYQGDPARIRYSMNSTPVKTTIRVLNEDGLEVFSTSATPGTGANEFVWNGQLNGGGAAPAGTYEVVIDALDAANKPITSQTVVEGTVRGLETQNGQSFLLVGERAVAIANVLNATQPSTSTDNAADALTLALQYIGLDVTFNNSEILFTGQPVDVDYKLDEDADRAQILVYNDRGQVVFNGDVNTAKGAHTYTWNGLNNKGQTVPPGEYNVVIDAIKQDTVLVREGTTTFNGTDPQEISYTLQADADRVEIEIRNAANEVIFTRNIDNDGGTNNFTWDGRNASGQIVPAGDYSYTIKTISDEDRRVTTSTFTSGRVTGVEQNNGAIFLNIGNRTIPLVNINGVNAPPPQG